MARVVTRMDQNIPTAQVVSVMGVTVNRAHETLLRSVIRYSAIICVFMLLYTIGSVIFYLSDEEPISPNQWLSLILFFCVCGVSVPLTGYLGAKQKDQNKLQMFAFGEGCVSFCSFTSIATTFYSVSMVVNYCDLPDCIEQFSNGTVKCTTYIRTQSGSGRGGGSTQRIEIAKDLCDDPYSYWYLWYVAASLGLMGVISAIATCKSVELKNRLNSSITHRRYGNQSSQRNIVGVSTPTVVRVPVATNRNVPDLPHHQPTMVIQPGSIQMVPMATQPVVVSGNYGEQKSNQPVLTPVLYKHGP